MREDRRGDEDRVELGVVEQVVDVGGRAARRDSGARSARAASSSRSQIHATSTLGHLGQHPQQVRAPVAEADDAERQCAGSRGSVRHGVRRSTPYLEGGVRLGSRARPRAAVSSGNIGSDSSCAAHACGAGRASDRGGRALRRNGGWSVQRGPVVHAGLRRPRAPGARATASRSRDADREEVVDAWRSARVLEQRRAPSASSIAVRRRRARGARAFQPSRSGSLTRSSAAWSPSSRSLKPTSSARPCARWPRLRRRRARVGERRRRPCRSRRRRRARRGSCSGRS